MSSLIRYIKIKIIKLLRPLPFFQKWLWYREFNIERKLLSNKQIPTNKQPSVIHYSVNKAATQFTKSIMLRCGIDNGLLPVRFSDYAWVSKVPYLFTLSNEEIQPYIHVFRPYGFLYTVFGGMVGGISNIDDYRTVVMLRDPRDVLVSGYYSYSISHAIPIDKAKKKEFLEFRERIKKMTVDEYVIEWCEEAKCDMSQYMKLKNNRPSVLVLKYEDMINDFPTWFTKLLQHCNWSINSDLRKEIESRAATGRNPMKEDVNQHRRQVIPGEYERKLLPETIDYLNNYLHDELIEFGYLSNTK